MSVAVSVVGLGKLGSCMAAAMASRGVRTIGVDIHAAPVEKIKKKLAPVWEPGLSEMILGCDGLLQATMDVNEAVHETDLTFVVVPTPSLPSGAFSLEYVCSVMRQVGAAIGKKDGYHLVVLSSTVLPGSTEHVVLPLLEESSGKCRGMGFGLCYSPEFIALGSVLRDFLNPDFLLIGECDAASGKKLASFYANEMQINARIARMTPVNAELTKIALNTFVTTKITYANMLAEICERLPGGDVDVVTGAPPKSRRPHLVSRGAERWPRRSTRACVQAQYQCGRGIAERGYSLTPSRSRFFSRGTRSAGHRTGASGSWQLR